MINVAEEGTILDICIALQVASVFGLFFVLISYLAFFPKSESYFRLIFFIILVSGCQALWWTITYLIGIGNPVVCMIQGVGDEYFYEASWFWPLFFAIYLYAANIKEREITVMWPFHVIAWGVPAVLVTTGYHFGVYGRYNLWCRITNQYFLLGIHEILLGIILSVQMFIFVHIGIKLFRIRRYAHLQSDSSSYISTSSRLLLFLILPAFCWILGLTDRGFELINGTANSYLSAAHNISSSGLGLMNALVYGWDPELLTSWAKFLKKLSHKLHRFITCKRDFRQKKISSYGSTRDYTSLSYNNYNNIQDPTRARELIYDYSFRDED